MHPRLAVLRMRGHHHLGRLLMHPARITNMHQDLVTPTTVHLMHQNQEEATRETISTVLQNPTPTRSLMEGALSVESKDILLANALARLLLQLSQMQLR